MTAVRSLPCAGHAVCSLGALTVLGAGLNFTGAAALPWWLVLAPLWAPLAALLLFAGLVAWCATGDER